MLRAIVARQYSAYGCSFEQMGGEERLFPGDHILIEKEDGSHVPAIIETFQGSLSSSAQGTYAYDCRLFPGQTPLNMVGLKIMAPTASQLDPFFATVSGAPLLVGEVANRSDTVSVVVDGKKLLHTHTGIFGSSGSGKSTLLGLLVEEILLKLPNVQVIALDPNSDFANFGTEKPEGEINHSANLCKKLSNLEISQSQAFLKQLSKIFTKLPNVYLGRFSVSDLMSSLKQEPNSAEYLVARHVWEVLDSRAAAITPQSLIAVLDELQKKNWGAGQVAHLPGEEATIAIASLRAVFLRILSNPVWAPAKADALDILSRSPRPPFIQFDLGNLGFEERALFSERALNMLWTRQLSQVQDTFVIVDEAHNLCPESIGEPWQRKTLDWINRIAGEGRKYGLYLIVVSQRPGKIHANTLDNCRNFGILRLPNADDISALARRAAEASPKLLSTVSALPKFHAFLYGDFVPPVIARVGRRRTQ